jgi:hypothetical protein
MSLEQIEIFEDDFDLFVLLNNSNKVEYLYDIDKLGTRGAMLKQIATYQKVQEEELKLAQVEDIIIGEHRICITKYDDVIAFNSDNLSLINSFARRIWLEGHILLRDKEVLKTTLDNYRYFKAFQIIKLHMPICEN